MRLRARSLLALGGSSLLFCARSAGAQPVVEPGPPPALAETAAPAAPPPPVEPATEAPPAPEIDPPAPPPDEAPVDADPPRPRRERPPDHRVLHGFRLGYMYLMHSGRPDPADPNRTVLEGLGLESPSSFLIGYEVIYRLVGHSWLDILLVGNILVAGLEQSTFLPSGNFLIGFEFDREIQLGVGIDLTPDRAKASHMIGAIGWTPQVGSFWVPVHFFVVPDVDGNHRLGATIGVTW